MLSEQSSQRQNEEGKGLHFALADWSAYLYHCYRSRRGHEVQGMFLHGSYFFVAPFSAWKASFVFSVASVGLETGTEFPA